ncbi:unnamed protein product [Closterium sp. NIES-53]
MDKKVKPSKVKHDQRPFFWEQQQLSLPLPGSVAEGSGGAGAGGTGAGGVRGSGAGDTGGAGAGGAGAGGAGGSGAGGARCIGGAGVDFFQTFSPIPKMTTLRVLLHVAAQRDYELHSLDFSTAFLQGSLHEGIWLRPPPSFTGSFPPGTQWSLWWPVYGLRQAPREWYDTLRTTLAALGFAPSSADPSLFLRTDPSPMLFYILVQATKPPSRPAAEPPNSRAAEPPNSRADEPPSRPATEPLSRPTAESPSRSAAEPLSRRAAQQPSRRAARKSSRPAAAPPSLPAAEPPSRPAFDLLLFLPARPDPNYSDWADGLSLFDSASPAPPATADSTVRSQWATRDAAARLAVRRHLPTTERAHFSQYKSAQTLYDAVVARYSSPATAALSRLMLPYLFPDLTAFPTVADLITHLRTSDTRYRAALPAEFCAKNPPPHVHHPLLHSHPTP